MEHGHRDKSDYPSSSKQKVVVRESKRSPHSLDERNKRSERFLFPSSLRKEPHYIAETEKGDPSFVIRGDREIGDECCNKEEREDLRKSRRDPGRKHRNCPGRGLCEKEKKDELS